MVKNWKKSNNVAPVKKSSNLWGIQYKWPATTYH